MTSFAAVTPPFPRFINLYIYKLIKLSHLYLPSPSEAAPPNFVMLLPKKEETLGCWVWGREGSHLTQPVAWVKCSFKIKKHIYIFIFKRTCKIYIYIFHSSAKLEERETGHHFHQRFTRGLGFHQGLDYILSLLY